MSSHTQAEERESQRRAARAANIAAFGLTATLPTDEAAAAINRRPQTLRKWACLENGPIRPVRINGRLAWRVADLEKLLNGEPLSAEPPSAAPSEPLKVRTGLQPERGTRTKQSRPVKATPATKTA